MSALHAVRMGLRDDTPHTGERQMDVLILKQLACSPPFGRWFLGQTGHTGAGSLELLRLLRSDSTHDGGTDLLVMHATTTGSRALLIDNKFGTPFTQSQPERYRTRGRAGIVTGCWQEFATVLMAPRHCLTEVAEGAFDHRVPYETIRHAIATLGDQARIVCTLKLLDCAIARSKKTPRSCWRGSDISL
jgi:hypothetical protein